MYKNKIKSRLEKISVEIKDVTFRKKEICVGSNLESKSNRKSKLSLSKDISARNCQRSQQSQEKKKRKYLKIVSNQKYSKDESFVLAHNPTQVSPKPLLKKSKIFEPIDDNNNITKSTVTLNQKILPLSTTQSYKPQECNTNNSFLFKTPIRAFKQNQITTSPLNTQSESTNRYKNQHKINLSPNPIKKISHSSSCKELNATNNFQPKAKEIFIEQSAHLQINYFATKLKQIHQKRKALQRRISSTLDMLTEKTRVKTQSREPQYQPNQQQSIKKPKVLCHITPKERQVDKNPASKIKQYKQSMKQKNNHLRSLIMNRIYS